MAQFMNVKADLRTIEGGYSNDPDDDGGETNFGISKRSYPDLYIKSLTFDQACVIYERDFWNKYRLPEIVNQELANKLFFALINTNTKNVIIALQRAIFRCSFPITIDGVLGTETIQNANHAPQNWLIDRLGIELSWWYLAIVANRKNQIKFLESWIRRALR
jgi:lysozyme family protein